MRLLVVTALVAGAVGTVAAASSAAPTWSMASSPSPIRPLPIPLSAVSCSSPSNCFAVGTRTDINHPTPSIEIEQWDGTIWTTHENQSARSGALNAVSCTSATNCFAVGYLGTGTRTLIERWDAVGRSWNPVPSQTPGGVTRVTLLGVSCSSANSCFAVGSYGASKPKTLIEKWDGKSWKTVASPNPNGSVNAYLAAVSCRSATSCFAVGGHQEAGDNKGGALVEQWNGTKWSIVPTPAPKVRSIGALIGVTPLLDGVSCSSPTSCMAVGYTASDALVEQWNGTKWSIVATPTPGEQFSIAELRAVSCSSARDCSAVGVTFLPVDQREGVERNNSIVEHWNGRAWTIVPKAAGVPTTKNYQGVGELSELSGVSCPTATSCAAVGNSAMPERWDGKKWSLAPLAGSNSFSQLNGVTCPSATSCFAVGTAEAQLEFRNNTLIEHWDGSVWSTTPSPTPSGTNVIATLNSISCVSPTDCTAVGGYFLLVGSGNALVEHWNGTKWSVVANPSPTKVQHDAALSSVSCVSATDCMAVGTYNTVTAVNGQFTHLLAEHWNGTAWSIIPISAPSETQLNAVSCSSATSCIAVGGSLSSGAALAERWNGTKWSVVATPAPSAGAFVQLHGLSCPSATDCTAVGTSQAGTAASQKTLVEHWNGTSWSVVAAPSPFSPRLSAVSCASATSCTAVGVLGESTSSTLSLVEQWDGSTWTTVPINEDVDIVHGGNVLNGVTCTSATTCVAVGYRGTSDGRLTYIQQST